MLDTILWLEWETTKGYLRPRTKGSGKAKACHHLNQLHVIFRGNKVHLCQRKKIHTNNWGSWHIKNELIKFSKDQNYLRIGSQLSYWFMISKIQMLIDGSLQTMNVIKDMSREEVSVCPWLT